MISEILSLTRTPFYPKCTKRQNELYNCFCELFLRVPLACLGSMARGSRAGASVEGALRKLSPNLTVQFILSHSTVWNPLNNEITIPDARR